MISFKTEQKIDFFLNATHSLHSLVAFKKKQKLDIHDFQDAKQTLFDII